MEYNSPTMVYDVHCLCQEVDLPRYKETTGLKGLQNGTMILIAQGFGLRNCVHLSICNGVQYNQQWHRGR